MFWALGAALLFCRKGSVDLPMEVGISARQAGKTSALSLERVNLNKKERSCSASQWVTRPGEQIKANSVPFFPSRVFDGSRFYSVY